MHLTLLLCLVCVFIIVSPTEFAPIVQTEQGRLRGKIVKSFSGKEIFSFVGIRFAEAPIGQHRFRDPLPLKPWSQIKDAVEDGPLCPQLGLTDTLSVSEDCLFLNVHTKTLRGKQPVIIYFHPGGFVTGSGNNLYTGPQYLLDHDVVLVTSNYRLSALGFISTGDSVMTGNYGLKDQLAVMKWVKQNIAQFGGDPDCVTLFGYSAGAGSVQLHMLSPLSRGLFHRVISSSYSATNSEVINRNPAALSSRLAKLLNCSTENSQQIRDCLVKLPAEDIIAATSEIWDTLQPPFSLFTPVIERHEGENRFLTDDPFKLIESGHFAQIPLIMGITRDEASWRAQYLLANSTYVERINTEFDEIAPWEFRYPREPYNLSKHISATLKHFYFRNQPVSNITKKELGELYADSRIIFSVYQAAKLIAEKSSAPVYFYLFNFEGRYSIRNRIGTNIPYGVSHLDDLEYLFYNASTFPIINKTDPEAYMVRTLTSLYSEFAKTGVPVLPGGQTKWSPMNLQHLQYLEISKPPKMKKGLPYPERMHIWESLFSLDQPFQQILY